MVDKTAQHLVCACPHCRTRFRVTEAALGVADGQVRCGACLSVFDGRTALVKPMAPAEPEEAQVLVEGDPTAEAPLPSHGGGVAPWVAGYVALGGALVVLVAVLQWPVWSVHPSWRGAYETACAALGCELPPLAALDAVQVRSRVIGDRAGGSAPLLLEVELLSRAPFRQPYPALGVTLRDAAGNVIDERRFLPPGYLPPDSLTRLTPNRRVALAVQLKDPGAQAASYALSLGASP